MAAIFNGYGTVRLNFERGQPMNSSVVSEVMIQIDKFMT
jgi:hypothetical protein